MAGGFMALMNKKGKEERKLKEIREAFDNADKDGDGKLSPKEWYDVLQLAGLDASW